MKDYDSKCCTILVVGPGREYFEDVLVEESKNFEENGLELSLSEGFSSPEITQLMISIGSNVIAGLSVYYISKLFDKIFTIKKKAAESGKKFQINVTISEKIQIRDVESTEQVEKAIEITLVNTTVSEDKN